MISSRRFQSIVYAHHTLRGRHTLPWRKTHNAYRILVSEIMLQQTQVDRVIPKYTAFLKQFPDVETLAEASLGDVLRAWQGLGYNKRAKMLHLCARCVVGEYGGRMPKSYEALCALPGIGPYTAGAIMAFAYNLPSVMIETNIRTVYLHHFFPDTKKVRDSALMPIIEKTVDHNNPREWYAALMDYGTFLKKTVGNVSRKSAHHTKQAKFKGSNREVRGVILRYLGNKPSSAFALIQKTGFTKERIEEQLCVLKKEGMIVRERTKYRLP